VNADGSRRTWHLAQYNIARLVAPLDSPQLADFVANLDRVNQLGDRSPGFVWRHQTAEGNSTAVRVRGDPMIIINFSVWEDADSLFAFTYRSDHAEVYRRRREWFHAPELPQLVLWWVPAGHEPSVAEAEERLDYLREHGPTAHAFTFKRRFEPAGQALTPRHPSWG
jgi:hypothetical protein